MKDLIKLNSSLPVPTKAEIDEQINKIVDLVDNGEVNPLRLYGQLAALEKVFATAKKAIVEYAINEHEKYGEKVVENFGARFERGEAGVKYDYSHIPAWVKLEVKREELRGKQVGIEAEAKRMGNAPKDSTTTIKVSFGK